MSVPLLMNVIIHVTAILSLLASIGCQSNKSAEQGSTDAGVASRKPVQQPSANVRSTETQILEIRTEGKYVVYPHGEFLNMRLFDSGRMEYDYFPPQGAEQPFSLERRETTLPKDEFERIKGYLVDPTLRAAKPEYEPTVPILDAAIETSILFISQGSAKKIVLKENHSNLILEKKGGIYPKALLELLLLVQEINRRLLG